MTDASGNTEFKYDLQGRLIQTKQTTGSLIRTVSYGFDALGRLASTTYPSGKVIGYSYNGNGQVTGMSVNGLNALTNITYCPFGPAQSWSFVNGATTTSYNYDASGRVALGHNRTRLQVGSAIGTYVVAAASNRLSSVTGANAISYGYDTAGNTVSNGVTTFAYDARGQLSSAAAVSYGVNGLGQRLTKAGTPIATGRNVYAYDQAGHLIGEYDTAGGVISEVVYLNDMPMLVLKATATYYVQTDQLDTPRSILNASNQPVTKWPGART